MTVEDLIEQLRKLPQSYPVAAGWPVRPAPLGWLDRDAEEFVELPVLTGVRIYGDEVVLV